MSRRSSRIAAIAVATAALAVPALAQDAVPVTVVTPKQVEVSERVRLTGTLTAERSARLSPRVDGLVARVHVDAGDRVKAGAPLLELDAAVARLALQRAQAGTAEAEARSAEARRLAEEARRLVAERHLPRTEFERREAEATLAAAALEASKAAEREQAEIVRRHVVPAPFAGVVARRLTDVGEWVARGTPVLELVATDRIRLDVQAPQERFEDIREDSQVEVIADAGGPEPLAGRIVARVPVGDPTARTFLVRILIEGAAGKLLPGTSATAEIGLAGAQQALAVPRDALLRYPDGTHSVFVLREAEGRTIVEERRVRLGRGGAQVEILEGIAPADRVVVRGNERLRNGQAVRIAGGA
jgi:RND family efflux transporter MFP subunit